MSEKPGIGEMFSQKMLTKGQNVAENVGVSGKQQAAGDTCMEYIRVTLLVGV
ncbi:MAG TPA: hypothetical protein VIK29_08330 [Paludibacter sp.]